MKRLKKMALKASGVLPVVALALGKSTVSNACVLWFHQPDIPEKLKKMMKR